MEGSGSFLGKFWVIKVKTNGPLGLTVFFINKFFSWGVLFYFFASLKPTLTMKKYLPGLFQVFLIFLEDSRALEFADGLVSGVALELRTKVVKSETKIKKS